VPQDHDLTSFLVGGGGRGLLDSQIGAAAEFADATAAQDFLDQNLDVEVLPRSAAPATATPLVCVTATVSSPATPGNFLIGVGLDHTPGSECCT
jgi:hypothetical protein